MGQATAARYRSSLRIHVSISGPIDNVTHPVKSKRRRAEKLALAEGDENGGKDGFEFLERGGISSELATT